MRWNPHPTLLVRLRTRAEIAQGPRVNLNTIALRKNIVAIKWYCPIFIDHCPVQPSSEKLPPAADGSTYITQRVRDCGALSLNVDIFFQSLLLKV